MYIIVIILSPAQQRGGSAQDLVQKFMGPVDPDQGPWGSVPGPGGKFAIVCLKKVNFFLIWVENQFSKQIFSFMENFLTGKKIHFLTERKVENTTFCARGEHFLLTW